MGVRVGVVVGVGVGAGIESRSSRSRNRCSEKLYDLQVLAVATRCLTFFSVATSINHGTAEKHVLQVLTVVTSINLRSGQSEQQ